MSGWTPGHAGERMLEKTHRKAVRGGGILPFPRRGGSATEYVSPALHRQPGWRHVDEAAHTYMRQPNSHPTARGCGSNDDPSPFDAPTARASSAQMMQQLIQQPRGCPSTARNETYYYATGHPRIHAPPAEQRRLTRTVLWIAAFFAGCLE